MKNRLQPILPVIGFVFLQSLFLSCKKQEGVPDNNSTTVDAPVSFPINSQVVAIAPGIDQTQMNLYSRVWTPGDKYPLAYSPTFDVFQSSGNAPLDRYFSTIEYTSNAYGYQQPFYQRKPFTALSTIKNYVNLSYNLYADAGWVNNGDAPQTLFLPNAGTLSFPAKPLSDISTTLTYQFFARYLDPVAKDYVLQLPAFPVAEKNYSLYYLDAYGVYDLPMGGLSCNCGIVGEPARFQRAATLRMPIPASKKANAPDSIEAWHLNRYYSKWEFAGFAQRHGDYYDKVVDTWGGWAFAKPLNAAFLTLQLRTTNNIPVPNTRYLVVNGNQEIAEGRTDADGNALLMVPAGRTLNLRIYDDQYYYTHNNVAKLEDSVLGSIKGSVTKKVVASDDVYLSTVEGTVTNCDGTPFGDGMVTAELRQGRDLYQFPISKGKFSMANWLQVNIVPTKLRFYNSTGNLAFETNTYFGSEYDRQIKKIRQNFYTCPDYNEVYCNYQIDNLPVETIKGTMSSPAGDLSVQFFTMGTLANFKTGTKGLSFSMYRGLYPEVASAADGTYPLMINNTIYQYDPNGKSQITLFRYDGVTGGFMEGWFAIDYVDAANKPHTITGTFRVRFV